MKRIEQTAVIDAKPEAVYAALMDSKKHRAFTGAAAKIDPKVGGKFACWDGSLTGFNVELVKGKRIVQAWRSETWPEGIWSIVRYELSGKGGKTTIRFFQEGVPDDEHADIRDGWKEYYWQPLQAWFSK